MSKIRVLVVDDSPIFREFLISGLKTDPDIEIAGVAGDPYEARDQILKLKPDVMTCDIEMPRMDGLEFVTKLIPQYPIPVVMISSLSDKVFDAMNAGAVDFVAKPSTTSRKERDDFIKFELIPKVKGAINATIKKGPAALAKPAYQMRTSTVRKEDLVIAIGASTGGTEAIFEVVRQFNENIPGIVITQHIPPKFSEMFAERLDRQCRCKCKEAKTGDIIKPGQILVAPGDKQMKVVKVGNNYQVECAGTDRVNGHCPSVDVLFDSVARTVGRNSIGILLTGMGSDGAKGLLNMRNAGAITIGQDRETSVVYGMPMEAYKLGAVKFQLPLSEIPKKVDILLQRF